MRRLLPLLLLAIVAGSGGCHMCACPYDYCGPVVECGCWDDSPGCYGGGLGHGEPIYNETPSTESVPTPAPAQPAPPSNGQYYGTPNASRPGSVRTSVVRAKSMQSDDDSQMNRRYSTRPWQNYSNGYPR